MTAVDQIHPLLTDLLESLHKISSLPPEWEGKVKIQNWYHFIDISCLTFQGSFK